MSDESDENAWLCDCGNYITDGCHCPLCGREPPWGCPCDDCQNPDENFNDDTVLDGIYYIPPFEDLP